MKKVVLLYAVMFLVLCGVHRASGQPRNELVVVQQTEVNSLDPAKHNSAPDLNYALQVFDAPYRRDERANPITGLVVSHKIINPTTWEFKLRPGVKFHDGETLTAKDVKFSIDRMTDPQTKAFFAPFWTTFKEVSVIDNLTFRITTTVPDPLMLKRLCWGLWIVPADLFQKEGAEAFFQHPVGTGPYKFVSWARNDRMVLDANEAYWDGAPKIKRVIFRAIPEAATRLAELQTGNADIITGIPPFLVDQVKNSQTAGVQSVPSGRVLYIYMNCLAKGPLQDKRVRQAINYAVNRKAIIDDLLRGSGIETAVDLTSYHWGYDPSLKPYPYDPARAKKLLAEAGYAKGLKLVFNTPNGRYMLDKEVCMAIAGMLREVGIETEMRVQEWGAYVQTVVNASKGLQDLGILGWGNTLGDADGTLTPLYTPDSAFSYYSTPALTDKIVKAKTTLDEKVRMRLYKEIQKTIFDEAPLIFLYQQVDHYGVSRKVHDFHARGDELLTLYKTSK